MKTEKSKLDRYMTLVASVTAVGYVGYLLLVFATSSDPTTRIYQFFAFFVALIIFVFYMLKWMVLGPIYAVGALRKSIMGETVPPPAPEPLFSREEILDRIAHIRAQREEAKQGQE